MSGLTPRPKWTGPSGTLAANCPRTPASVRLASWLARLWKFPSMIPVPTPSWTARWSIWLRAAGLSKRASSGSAATAVPVPAMPMARAPAPSWYKLAARRGWLVDKIAAARIARAQRGRQRRLEPIFQPAAARGFLDGRARNILAARFSVENVTKRGGYAWARPRNGAGNPCLLMQPLCQGGGFLRDWAISPARLPRRKGEAARRRALAPGSQPLYPPERISRTRATTRAVPSNPPAAATAAR